MKLMLKIQLLLLVIEIAFLERYRMMTHKKE